MRKMNRVLALLLAFTMVFTLATPAFAWTKGDTEVNFDDLVNEYYKEDTGMIKADPASDCIGFKFTVEDDKGNLLGYHVEKTNVSKKLAGFIAPVTGGAIANIVALTDFFVDVRTQDDFSFKVYTLDGAGNKVYLQEDGADAVYYADEFGMVSVIPEGGMQHNITYFVEAFEFEATDYTDVTKTLKFVTDDKGCVAAKQVYKFKVNPWCFTLRTVLPNWKPAPGEKVALHNLKTLKADKPKNGGEGYKYELKTDKTYKIAGDALATFTTNNDGYSDTFTIVKTNATDADGYVLWNVVVKGIGDVGQIREGEFLGLTPNGGNDVYVLNPWRVDEINRLDQRDPAFWPTVDYVVNCGQTVMVPIGELTATLRVRVFHADEAAQTRLPVVGAVVGLYENASEIWGKITAGKELSRGTTDKNGIVEFYNVPLSETFQYLGPVLNNAYLQALIDTAEHNKLPNGWFLYGGTPVVDLNELVAKGDVIALPYLIKQISAPEGFSFDEGTLYPALVQKGDLNNTKFVEIRNYKDNLKRIFGPNRYSTAVEIAKELFPNGPEMYDNYRSIILATGNNFADALVGGVLAQQYNSPLLLTDNNKLSPETAKYIQDFEINRVILLGGPYSISEKVRDDIVDLGVQSIPRLNGANREETAVLVGENVISLLSDDEGVKFNKGFTHNGRVFLAYAGDFADALTASVPASEFGTPILLTQKNALSPATKQALKDWKVREVIIVGGPASVSEAVKKEIEQMSNITVDRYYGENRATTAMDLAKHYYNQTHLAYVASGDVYPDALAGALLAAKDSAPILLVGKDSVNATVAKYIADSNITELIILGGPNTVSEQVRVQLGKIITGQTPGITPSNP